MSEDEIKEGKTEPYGTHTKILLDREDEERLSTRERNYLRVLFEDVNVIAKELWLNKEVKIKEFVTPNKKRLVSIQLNANTSPHRVDELVEKLDGRRYSQISVIPTEQHQLIHVEMD